MRYAVKLMEDGGAFVVTCRDLPAFNSVGDTVEEALRESVDGIALALEGYMDERAPIPAATEKKRGEHWVSLPALDVAKIGLYQAMLANHLRKADLVRLLGVHAPQVDRLLSLSHKSKLEQVEDALGHLGYRVNVTVERVTARYAA
ncbi:type II toxin-antitoxin system HicB family antitoxin [Dyella psychrodurans]|uniref:Type II toxin-antitoxin system HicB family antitoxin n=1 Tax=Dyella psychrodurans TaxID=1927960 RepID=A0A370XC58_9GAMM|nr:type II toxin-antitoxin system HicB family antitoxin [Dyella psychrodurans]RDS86014.1 type II toxin-antitoxin system HicB family antitoxin [Dyella psychrodurans]